MKRQNQYGTALRMARLAKGLTQEDFANESGRTYISEVERGVKQPTLQKIDELAVPLGVHPLTTLALAYLVKYDVLSADTLLDKVRAELQGILQFPLSK